MSVYKPAAFPKTFLFQIINSIMLLLVMAGQSLGAVFYVKPSGNDLQDGSTWDNAKATIMQNILSKVNALGFEIEDFGNKTYLIHGIPAGLAGSHDATRLMEKLIDQYVSNMEFQLGIEENLARSLAVSAAIKRGKPMEVEEMKLLIDQLFACEVPYKSPTGRRCIVTMDLDTILKQFTQ